MTFILSIDQGTTQTTALLVDKYGAIIGSQSSPLKLLTPKESFVEQSLDDIKKSVKDAVTNVLKSCDVSDHKIAAITITNQRETTCFFDQNSESQHNAIVWQCKRSQKFCETWQQKGFGEIIHKRTGLTIDPYFSASKIVWALANFPKLKEQIEEGSMKFGTIDTFLTHWFSGGKDHITDVSNASRTMLMNLNNLSWDDSLLDILTIPKKCLPFIVPSAGSLSKTKDLSFLRDGIPITAMIGDQQAALYGHGCISKKSAKLTFGTGCFLLASTEETPVLSKNGLITSVFFQKQGKKTQYCLEGANFVGGALFDLLKDNLAMIKDFTELEILAREEESSQGLIFIPTLCGTSQPKWQPLAKGAILGMTRKTTKSNIARSAIEGIALQNCLIIDAMKKDGLSLENIYVDGGCVSNDLLLQMQADYSFANIIRGSSVEKTAFGAAKLGGEQINFFANDKKQHEQFDEFLPKLPVKDAIKIKERFLQATEALSSIWQ